MNKLKLLLALVLMMPVILSANTIVNISLVNNIFDTHDEGMVKLGTFLKVIDSVVADNYSGVGDPKIQKFGYINVGGQGEGSFNDYLAEFLADVENREEVIDRLIRDGSFDSNSDEITRLQEVEREMGSILLEMASKSNPIGFVTKLILEEVAQASENEWGDTARRTKFYTDLLSTQECVIMFAENFGLGMALKIKQNIEMRSLYEENQIQVIPIDFSNVSFEEEFRSNILSSVEAARTACGFRITEAVNPGAVTNSSVNGTPVELVNYWAGLPDFPVTLHTALNESCKSFECSVANLIAPEGNTAFFETGQNPLTYFGRCFGDTRIFSNSLIPNSPVNVSYYVFLEDAEGVTTNSVKMDWTCTYIP